MIIFRMGLQRYKKKLTYANKKALSCVESAFLGGCAAFMRLYVYAFIVPDQRHCMSCHRGG